MSALSLKEGDVVHVRAKVRDANPMFGPNVRIRVVGYCPSDKTALVPRSDVLAVEPAPLRVGDKVTNAARTETGEILFIADNRAWVRSHPNKHVTLHLSDLTRVETPRTRRDQLAEAFPHLIDRIVSVAKEQGRSDTLGEPADKTAGDALCTVFIWVKTTEGLEYWFDLARANR